MVAPGAAPFARRVGADAAPLAIMHQPAQASEVALLLGDVDPLTIARILEIGPSIDEIDEALRAREDELAAQREPSTARVAEVRAVLDELETTEEVDEGVPAS